MFEDTVDYYPTPEELATIMVTKISEKTRQFYHAPGPILEPSAGTGSLVKAMYKLYNPYHGKDVDVDCIEISPNCRAILKENGFRVIHDDFMTFEAHKRYAAIVMNPPFSSGIKHLKKAIEIMHNGGVICCLLPAENIRNPRTKEQTDLVVTLKRMDAEIGYFKGAFERSEHPTKVEVALIVLRVPEKPADSRIFNDMKAAREKKVQDAGGSALVSNDPIAAAVIEFDVAAKGLEALYSEYAGIESLLYSPIRAEAEKPAVTLGKSYNEALKTLRAKYWMALFNIPSVRDVMTETIRRSFMERLDTLSDYDFTVYNVATIRLEISKELVSGVKDEIIRLFDWFTTYSMEEFSSNVHYYNGWKTNKAYKVNDKIVFPCYTYDKIFKRFDLVYQVADMIANIERVLHFLDTSGKPYDSNALRNTLKLATEKQRTANIQCQYFSLTFYKKGTCHLTFLNKDVLKTFNAFAAQHKNWLPPTYGKKHYAEMSKEDKDVIRNYESVQSYEDSYNRGLIVSPSNIKLLSK